MTGEPSPPPPGTPMIATVQVIATVPSRYVRLGGRDHARAGRAAVITTGNPRYSPETGHDH
jgi:hypothetical protein